MALALTPALLPLETEALVRVVLRGITRHRGHERGRVVVAVRPEAMVRLCAGRACKHDGNAKGDEKRLHRDTSKSKRSTNSPARVEPSRYNDEPASRKRAS